MFEFDDDDDYEMSLVDLFLRTEREMASRLTRAQPDAASPDTAGRNDVPAAQVSLDS